MKVYSPGEIADLLKIKDSTLRKYSLLLEDFGYEFQKNSRNQRYYTDEDIITLRKLITMKDNGMTLDESAKGVVMWHKGNEVKQTDIALSQTDTHNVIIRDDSDIQELKTVLHKQIQLIQIQNESIEELKKMIQSLDKKVSDQQEYIGKSMKERDQALMQVMNEMLENRKLIAEEKKKGFWSRLFGK